MTTLKKQLEESMEPGETVEAVIFERVSLWPEDPAEDYGLEDYEGYPDIPFGKPLTYADALPFMVQEFYDGHGTQTCPNMTVWTNRAVYYVDEYDGATGIGFVLRNPPIPTEKTNMNDEKKIDDGGPAFPESVHYAPELGECGQLLNSSDAGVPGMSFRDYLAAKAMRGLVANDGYWYNGPSACDDMAYDAYQVADAMLKARKL